MAVELIERLREPGHRVAKKRLCYACGKQASVLTVGVQARLLKEDRVPSGRSLSRQHAFCEPCGNQLFNKLYELLEGFKTSGQQQS